jgi:Protein of unknown function (DUF1553)/Protein of unknown function (DUF1549)/Planctomycete cytochrome C
MIFSVRCWAAGLAGFALLAALGADNSDVSPDYIRDVRPILSKHCFRCHGPDEDARKAKLRLDLPDGATNPAKSGAIAVKPGKPAESELVKRILTADPDEVMPPPSSKIPLDDAQKALLRRWVASGAEYKAHWAFVPPRRPPIPKVSKPGWVRNGIDAFVLARLDKEGLAPSAEADAYTLVRRVYLDLIGLPPTPAEADEFVRDRSPGAYERLVDRLLSSPRYGERWARRWMDLARYADSNGYEKDRQRNIWPWRDWVVKALNADMPFDEFTVEQLAGDLLPNATLDQRVATGFHRNTMLNEEGGIDPLEFRFHAMTDRVNTTGTTWLGLTVGCCQCHTHKYDPLPQREYYQVMAFLNNADEPDLDLPAANANHLRADAEARAERLKAGLADRFPVGDVEWRGVTISSAASTGGDDARLMDDGSALFSGPSPDRAAYALEFDTDWTLVDGFKLETLTDPTLPKGGPGRVAHGNFVLSEIRVTASPTGGGPAREVAISSATADVEQDGFPITAAFDGKSDTGWAVHSGDKLNQPHNAVFRFKEPVNFPGGARFKVTLVQEGPEKHLIGRPRFSVRRPVEDARPIADRRRTALQTAFEKWLAAERTRAVAWTPLRPANAASNLPLLAVEPDDSVFASGDITKSDTYELTFHPPRGRITALRLEALPDDRLPGHGPGMAYYEGPKGDFFLTEFELNIDGVPAKIDHPSASYAGNNFGDKAGAALAVDGDPQTGWSAAGRSGERSEAVFPLSAPVEGARELKLTMHFGRHYACSLGRFRISTTAQSGDVAAQQHPPEIQALLAKPASSLTTEDNSRLLDHFLMSTPELADAQREIRDLLRPPPGPVTMVLRERPAGNPRPTHIHKRGEYQNLGDEVQPGVFASIAPFPPTLPKNRLGFAKWLVSADNPLTSRVTVNRQWQAFFGRGIVRTTEDFGIQGEAPSHPELLDWLATQFIRDGWSMKALHRLIATSATYRQGPSTDKDLVVGDPDNHLLARGPVVRLEAEILRDAALRAGGLLTDKIGGPGVYPPQPAGVTEVAYGSPSWPTSTGADRYRRSLYTFAKRTAPFALFNTFDAPSGESCLARRDVSDTPLQALTVLNDILFLEVSQAMGRSLAAAGGKKEARIEEAFRRCVTRPPTAAESALLARFYDEQKGRFASHELDATKVAGPGGEHAGAGDRAAWTAVARALLNLDETITKN